LRTRERTHAREAKVFSFRGRYTRDRERKRIQRLFHIFFAAIAKEKG
jgi:hypothetical protein